MFHLLWLPRPGRPLDCRLGKPPPPPYPSSRISRFLDFKISRESSSTRDRATDPKELSTRTDLSSADLEILTASQDFPADSALQHKCFDHQQWCIWHFAQVHQLCRSTSALMTNRVSQWCTSLQLGTFSASLVMGKVIYKYVPSCQIITTCTKDRWYTRLWNAFNFGKDFLANETFLHMFDENETRREGATVSWFPN